MSATPRTPRERDRLLQAITFAGLVIFAATMWSMAMLALYADRLNP